MQKISFQMRHKRHRPLHKRVALHPFSILLFLCLGVVLVISTLRVQAEDIVVTAKVSAPLPSAPAVITSPQDQDRVSTDTIQVIGTCPADAAYVAIYRNGVFAGVGQCASNAFQVQISLTPGANQLLVKVYNSTDDEGPPSTPITVYYDPPVTPVPPTPQPPVVTPPEGGPTGPSGPGPLTATTEYKYQTHFTGGFFEWIIQIQGGRLPYTIVIDWKDGKKTEVRSDKGQSISLRHAFDTAGTYEPLITVTDAEGNVTYLQLVAFVKSLPNIGLGSSILSLISDYLWLMWPAYGVVVLMLISFWLGELEIVRRSAARRRKKA